MPVITPNFEISIENAQGTVYMVPAVKSITVKTSRGGNGSRSDTASVELPSMKGLELETFKRGDLVQIKLGHQEPHDPLKSVFLGVITNVGPRLPVSFEAKDPWHLIRNLNLPFDFSETVYQDAKLVEIADDISRIWKLSVPGSKTGPFDLRGVSLIFVPENFQDDKEKFPYDKMIAGKFYLDPRLTVEQAFNVLLKRGWDLSFIPGTKELYFGPRNTLYIIQEQEQTPIFRRGLNIIDNNLEFIEGETIRKVTVWRADNDDFTERINDKAKGEWELVGADPAGRVIEVIEPGIEANQDALDGRAEEIYWQETEKNSYSGKLRTFGLGFFKHSMKLKLEMGDGHDGHYFADRVNYSYSAEDGFKMDIHLDKAQQN